MCGNTKRRNSDTQGNWTGCPQLQRAFNYGHEPNIRCFVAKSGLSRVTRTWGGGSQKMTSDDEGEGGGQDTPQKWWRHLWTAPYIFIQGCAEARVLTRSTGVWGDAGHDPQSVSPVGVNDGSQGAGLPGLLHCCTRNNVPCLSVILVWSSQKSKNQYRDHQVGT